MGTQDHICACRQNCRVEELIAKYLLCPTPHTSRRTAKMSFPNGTPDDLTTAACTDKAVRHVANGLESLRVVHVQRDLTIVMFWATCEAGSRQINVETRQQLMRSELIESWREEAEAGMRVARRGGGRANSCNFALRRSSRSSLQDELGPSSNFGWLVQATVLVHFMFVSPPGSAGLSHVS